MNQRDTSQPPVRIGILGTARINRPAILWPARCITDVVVAAVASRSSERAARYARKAGIARHYGSYAALIDDPDIDLIYNSLPNSLHAEWSIRALEAERHVLFEKPLAANADEAAHLARVADRSGRLLVEGFHYRYHPLARRLKWNWRAYLRVTGDRGRMFVLNPFLPQFYNFIRVRTNAGRFFERATMSHSTYRCQLEAVVSANSERRPGADGRRRLYRQHQSARCDLPCGGPAAKAVAHPPRLWRSCRKAGSGWHHVRTWNSKLQRTRRNAGKLTAIPLSPPPPRSLRSRKQNGDHRDPVNSKTVHAD